MDKEVMDKLMEIKKLYEAGVLTKEEMETEKAKMLPSTNVRNTNKANNSESDSPDVNANISDSKPSEKCKVQDAATSLSPTRQGIKTSKDSTTVYRKNNKYDFLLWWVVIYIVVGVVAELIRNILNGNGLWYESVVYRNIFFLLLIIREISNIIPALAVKNKIYRIPCVIGVGLLSLYYIYETIHNMMQY